MAYKRYWKPGTSLGICDRCGRLYTNDRLKLEWTGLLVCEGCWDYRHPQELIRSFPDTQSPPVYPRPEAVDQYANEGILGQGIALAQDPLAPDYANLILQENGQAIYLD